MNFIQLIKEVNKINKEKKDNIQSIVDNIDIDEKNINNWIDNIFSDNINSFDMKKLPYLIDELYKTDDKLKFMLCCMLLESSCDKLDFITNLEKYPLFKVKYETLIHTLTTVYDMVDNGIANCMALIIINNDPEFKYIDEESKNIIKTATKRKLNDILEYLKKKDINPLVYEDLEVIVDLACYLNDKEISKLIDEIDNINYNENADIFIIKYKIINNMKILENKLNILKNDMKRLVLLYSIMEKLGVNNIYLKDIEEENIAKSDMIRWLSYPTELGSVPDKIELLGEFIYNNFKYYAYKFSKEGFSISGDLLGVSGGYPIDKVSSITTGHTFSKFEKVSDSWEKQSKEIVDLISNHWKNSVKF